MAVEKLGPEAYTLLQNCPQDGNQPRIILLEVSLCRVPPLVGVEDGERVVRDL